MNLSPTYATLFNSNIKSSFQSPLTQGVYKAPPKFGQTETKLPPVFESDLAPEASPGETSGSWGQSLKGWLWKGLGIVAGTTLVSYLFKGKSLVEQGKALFQSALGFLDKIQSGISHLLSFLPGAAKAETSKEAETPDAAKDA